MMKYTSIILSLLLSFSSFASDKINLKLNQGEIERLIQAIVALDKGTTKTVEKNGTTTEVNVSYQFSGETQLALVKNLDALVKASEDFDKVKKKAIKEIWGDKPVDEAKDTEQIKKFNEQMTPVWETKVDVELHTIKLYDVEPKQTIKTLHLRALMPIVTDPLDKAPEKVAEKPQTPPAQPNK